MEVAESRPSSGYALGSPWLFKGSALYQLHLVKAETARAFIPKDLKLVEAFGYTLGIVWNPPTSCAWAARVLVNNHEACKHGQKEIGLPSHVGIFSKRAMEIKDKPINKSMGFLDMFGMGPTYCKPKEYTEIQVSELQGSSRTSLCNISLPFVGTKWMGPTVRMLLPSFSGKTIHKPHLLKYSCQIECRVRAVEAAKISGPAEIDPDELVDGPKSNVENLRAGVSAGDDACDRSIAVLLSKPILALEFNLLKMQVETPTILDPRSV